MLPNARLAPRVVAQAALAVILQEQVAGIFRGTGGWSRVRGVVSGMGGVPGYGGVFRGMEGCSGVRRDVSGYGGMFRGTGGCSIGTGDVL